MNKKGMTLLELLAVISIIVILFILLVPQVSRAVEKSRFAGLQVDCRDYYTFYKDYRMNEENKKVSVSDYNKYLNKELQFTDNQSKEKNPWKNTYQVSIDEENNTLDVTSNISSSKDYTVSCFNQNLVFANLSDLGKEKTDEIIGDGTLSPDDNNSGSVNGTSPEDTTDGSTVVDPDKSESNSFGEDDSHITDTPPPDPEPTLNTCREDGLESTPEEYFTTTSYSYGVKITAYSSSGPTDVVIPCQINGKDVLAIGTSGTNPVFKSTITSVKLNKDMQFIGDYAMSTSGITSMHITKNVTEIGDRAFYKATSLKTLTFENDPSLTSIGQFAFSNTGIESLNMPDTVSSIGVNAFEHTSNLSSVSISSRLSVIPKYAFQFSGITTLTIPSNISSIEDYAFRSNTSMSHLSIEEGPYKIATYAFSYNTSLSYVYIPSSVTTMDRYSFYGSKNIQLLYNYSSVASSKLLNIGEPTIMVN